MTSPPSPTKTINVGLGGIAIKPERLRALRPDRVREIAESMKINGLLQPIVLRTGRGEGYWLVAGWHRFEAAKLLKWPSIRANIFEGMKADASELAEIDENLIRADLTLAERAAHTAARKPLYEKLHPETKHGGDRKSKSSRQNGDSNDRFTKDTAKKTGKSERNVQRDAHRGEKIVVLADVTGTCLDKSDELDALTKLPPSEQRNLAGRAQAGERVSAKTRVKQIRRETRQAELALSTEAAAVALGQEPPASIIFADPALRFIVWSEHGDDRSADNHYPTDIVEKMAALKPPAAETSLLLLWTWSPQLKNSLAIMEAWGFEYKAYWGWDKQKTGTGYWAQSRLELVLIGTRGNFPAPAMGEQLPHLISSARGKHSSKPEIYYEWIERIYPDLSKLEMFARKPRKGWRTWGNEAETAEAAE